MGFNMDLALESWYTNSQWEYEPEEYIEQDEFYWEDDDV